MKRGKSGNKKEKENYMIPMVGRKKERKGDKHNTYCKMTGRTDIEPGKLMSISAIKRGCSCMQSRNRKVIIGLETATMAREIVS